MSDDKRKKKRNDEIDDSLYSRQRYVLGDQAMKKMATSKVFLSGLGGVGVEIAKNIILAGIKQLTIHDDVSTSFADLSSQFYLSSDLSNIGKNRASVSLPKLRELNPYVSIKEADSNILHDDCDLSFLDKFHCVVLTGKPLSLQLKVNEYCHSRNISFISCDVRGIITWAFVDNGDNFVVTDTNGENTEDIMIANITNENPAVISCLEHRYHDLETGDQVLFSEVKGCDILNGKQLEVTVIDPHSFSVNIDTSNSEVFQRGNAIASKVKVPKTLSFLSLKESLQKPEIIDCDFGKFGVPQQLFIGMQALYKFQDKHNGSLPKPWNNEDANEFISLAKQINTENIELEENLLKLFSFTASGELQCYSAFMGGVIGQEVIKSLSGKFTPLHQWMFLDAQEVIPENAIDDSFDRSIFMPKEDRYDSLRICIGNNTLQELASTKLFMVGAGAIGCEMMKNFAMLGVATNGKIILTDNDLIEKSNLNRQFLFRPKDIQSPKSTTAASAAAIMNPDIKVDSMLDKVGPQTEDKFSNTFFSTLDMCVNALDNVEARLYMDQRIVANQLPLLESGTLGPKGHVQVVIPFQSESYSSQSDPKSKDIPFCTLKSFPNSPEHCTIWARDLVFEENLVTKAKDLQLFIETEDLAEKLEDDDPELCRCLPNVYWLIEKRPKSFQDCITFARLFFENNYKNSMLQLLKKFPLDHQMNDGTMFWAAPRRAPTPLDFKSDDPLHYSFIYNLSILWAEVWNIKVSEDKEEIIRYCESVDVPKFVPSESVEIETDENAEKPKGKETQIDVSDMEAVKKKVLNFLKENSSIKVSPLDFEKDDDTNHHIDMITAATNLRARCYSIKEANRLEIKRIAGNITPAIATTTSAVAGLVGLELIKLRQKPIKSLNLESFKNAFINLAISLYALSEPGPVERTKVTDKHAVTMWDRWEIRGDESLTLQEFFDKLKKKYKLTPVGVAQGSSMIYLLLPMYKKKLSVPLKTLVKETQKRKCDMVVTFTNSKGQNVEGVPIVRYSIKRPKKSSRRTNQRSKKRG